MTLPSLGNPLSLNQIQGEFGGSNPISLSEYYAGGLYVPPGAFGRPPPAGSLVSIPSSGQISIANFYASQNLFIYNVTTNTNNLAINSTAGTALKNAGWNGISAVRVVVKSSVTVSATSTAAAAMQISGSFPAGLEIVTEASSSSIIGCGGAGGTGATISGVPAQAPNSGSNAVAGGSGGTAISISSYSGPTIIISNYGNIRGGGGGGGGGASGWNYASKSQSSYHGGGGGGGGRSSLTNSSAGSGGSASGGSLNYSGASGGAGTSSSAGSGGAGGSGTAGTAGSGGSGGGYGSTGSSGGNVGAGLSGWRSAASGGSGGAAVTGYGSASLTNYGSGGYSGSLVT